MSLFIFVALALAQAQSKTHQNPPSAGHHKVFDPFSRYGVTYVGPFTPAEKREVDNQLSRTLDLTDRYKKGKIMDVYLLGREYYEEYRNQNPICSTSQANWSDFGNVFASAALRLGHVEEALKVFKWIKRKTLWTDVYGVDHALQGLIDLKHGNLAGAKKEVGHYDALVGNPNNGMSAPKPTTKNGVTALCYLGIDRFGSIHWDYALEAQYDAFAVKFAPDNVFCIIQEARAEGLMLNFKAAVATLTAASMRLSGTDLRNVNWYLYSYQSMEANVENEKKLGIKPNTGKKKP